MNDTLICYPELPEGYEYRAFNDGMGFYDYKDSRMAEDIDILAPVEHRGFGFTHRCRAWATRTGAVTYKIGENGDRDTQFSNTQEALNWLAIQLWLGEIE